jgi:hypothetical protein
MRDRKEDAYEMRRVRPIGSGKRGGRPARERPDGRYLSRIVQGRWTNQPQVLSIRLTATMPSRNPPIAPPGRFDTSPAARRGGLNGSVFVERAARLQVAFVRCVEIRWRRRSPERTGVG